MRDWYVDQLAKLTGRLRKVERDRVTYRSAEVVAVDAGTATFSAAVPDAEDLHGITAPPQFLPAVGDTVRLAMAGATPIYEPGSIAENAITGREIAPGSVAEEALSFDLADLGGTTVNYGAATPTGTPLIGDLWLKELAAGPPPRYETRRWTGAAWTLLADQKVTDALAAAVAAQTAADAANQKGVDAIAAAAAAQGVAAAKTTTFRQSTAPSTTGRTVGDQWYDTANGNRLSVWGGNNAWNLAPLGATGIAATARDLGAITTYKQATQPTTGMIAGDYWLDSDDGNKAYRYSGSTWELVQDQSIVTALSNAATAQATADGKVRIFPQASAPTGMTAGDVGDMWIDTDDSNVTYTWSGTAWTKRQIGNGAIQPQSLVASNVIATGTITAALLEALMVLTNVVIAGNPTGEHTRLTATGLAAYLGDPTGSLNEVARFGRNSGGRNDAGELTWTIDQNGRQSVRSISVTEDVTIGGTPLAESLVRRTQGLIAHGVNGALQSGISLEFGVLEVGFQSADYRNYRIVSNLVLSSTVNDGEVVVRVRFSSDGSRPTINSPILAERYYTLRVADRWNHVMFDGIRQHPAGFKPYMKFLLTVQRGNGQTTGTVATVATSPTMHVYDEGILNFASGTAANDGSVGGTSTPAPARQVYEAFASWGQTFRGDNSLRSDTTDMVQGLDPSGFNGDGKALIGFPDLTSLLTGASRIESVLVYLYNYRWYGSGGEAILGSHGYAAAPGAPGTANFARVRRAGWGEAQGLWVDLTGWAAEFQSGQTRGITLGPSNSGDLGYYGRFLGPADTAHPDLRPKIQVVYWK